MSCVTRLPAGLVLGSLVALVGAAVAQPAADIATLTTNLTSEDQNVRSQAFQSLLAMGDAGVQGLLAVLANPEGANLAGAEYGLHGLAAHYGRPDVGAERTNFVRLMCGYLTTAAPAEAKRFVISRVLQYAGRDEAVPTLAGLLTDQELGECARQALIVNSADAAGKALMDAVPKSTGALRASIIQALGHRKEAKAVDLLIAETSSTDAAVRIAAIEALGRIGDSKAEKAIAAALGKGTPREQQAAFTAYLLLGETLLADKKAPEALKVYSTALRAGTQGYQRCAALVGLGQIATPDVAKILVAYVADPDPTVRTMVTNQLAQLPGPQVSGIIADAMKTMQPRIRAGLLRVLARRQEPEASKTIEQAANDPDPEVKVTACELLGRLNDPALEGVLLQAATSGSDVIHPVALDAYMSLAGTRLGRGELQTALAMYDAAFAAARTPELKGKAVIGYGAVGGMESLAKVEPLLQDEPLRPYALRAYVSLASSVAATDKQKAIDMLQKALALGPPRDVLQMTVAKLNELGVKIDPASASGFVTHWWILGPIRGQDLDAVYPPEQGVDLAAPVKIGQQELRWIKHHVIDLEGIVNLLNLLNPNQDTTAYLYAEVTVEQAQDVTFKIGTDDAVRCWLNGRVIHTFGSPRSLQVDQDKVDTHLEAGVNKILLKINQGGGDWCGCLRITDRTGKPVKLTQRE